MIILHNGIIHTLNALQPTVEALAISDKHIFATGKNEDILALATADTKKIDLRGKSVIPGITDAHIHLLQYGRKLRKIDCETSSKQACLDRVAQAVEQAQPGEWILGQGWDHNQWREGIGTRYELDSISPDHPVFLESKSLHSSWVNSLALKKAGIDKTTPEPSGGKIVRDEDGEATGILLESATLLVEDALPSPDKESIAADLRRAQKQLLQYGITSVHDVDEWLIYPRLKDMQAEGYFPLRIVKSIPRSHLEEAVQLGLTSSMRDEHFQIGWLKLFMDGALGPQTAAMLEPYENSSEMGMLTMSEQELVEVGEYAYAHGISLEVHAIGDRAMRSLLTGFEQIHKNAHRTPSLPSRIEHVQIIHPDDIPQMAALGVVASMQPFHVISDMETADRFWGERCRYAYAWNAIQQAGIPLVFGSDAPVESPNPFPALQAAITRQKANHPEAWYPEQCLTMEQALQAYCVLPARISRNPQLGSLSKGKLADLVVLPSDPFSMPSMQMGELSPIATMIEGRFVWKKPGQLED